VSHPVLERLASRHPDERRAACRAAAADPSAVVLIDGLGEALGDPVKAVQRAASDALAQLGREHDAVVPLLRDALHTGDARRRFGAAFTLARLEPPDVRLLPALVEALAFADGDLRWSAARLLVETGRLHGEVLPLLLGLVRGDGRPTVRRMATFCLRELAPDLPEAASALLAATRDGDLPVRRAAFTALAALLDPPPDVIRRLVEAVDAEPDPASRRIAAVALGELGAGRPEALAGPERAALERAAGAGDEHLRRAARRALARAGEPPR
jgi:HEAT repeat protein